MPNCAVFLTIALVACAGLVRAQGLSTEGQLSPQLGQRASEALVSAWDVSVLPSGEGLPKGAGTPESGALLYQKHCAACHGEGGSGGLNNVLVSSEPGPFAETGGKKTVGNYWPYATTVFDYIRRAMPYSHPQSLDDSEVYALTAYLLYRNAVVPAEFEATATTLPQVSMPNQANFIWAYPGGKP